MSKQEIDEYLATLDGPKRSNLEELRTTILAAIPEAEQGMAYGMPAFKLNGKVIAGFGAFKNHLSYFPHSGSVIQELTEDVSDYVASKGTLQFPVDTPLPGKLVEELIAVRLRQIRS